MINRRSSSVTEALLQNATQHTDDLNAIKEAIAQYQTTHQINFDQLRFKIRVKFLEVTDNQGQYRYPPLFIIPQLNDLKTNLAWSNKIKNIILNRPGRNGLLSLGNLAHNSKRIFVLGSDHNFIGSNVLDLDINKLKLDTPLETMTPGTIMVFGSAIGSLIKKLNDLDDLQNNINPPNSPVSYAEANQAEEQEYSIEFAEALSDSSDSSIEEFIDKSDTDNTEYDDTSSASERDDQELERLIKNNNPAPSNESDLPSDSEEDRLEKEKINLQEHNVFLKNELNKIKNVLHENMLTEIKTLQQQNDLLSQQVSTLKQHDDLFKNKKFDDLIDLNNDIDLDTKTIERDHHSTMKRNRELSAEYQQIKTNYKNALKSQATLFKQKNDLLEEKLAKKQKLTQQCLAN